MTDLELLEKIKSMSIYTNDYHDTRLLHYIEDAKDELYDAGVSREAIENNCGGVIAQIVVDKTDNGGITENTYKRIAQKALSYPRGDRE